MKIKKIMKDGCDSTFTISAGDAALYEEFLRARIKGARRKADETNAEQPASAGEYTDFLREYLKRILDVEEANSGILTYMKVIADKPLNPEEAEMYVVDSELVSSYGRLLATNVYAELLREEAWDERGEPDVEHLDSFSPRLPELAEVYRKWMACAHRLHFSNVGAAIRAAYDSADARIIQDAAHLAIRWRGV